MTRELKSERKGPQKADSVVVFLHGYGADGADLLGLADPLAPHLPRTAFYAPNAPERCVNNPMGYQWFPIPWMDGSSEEQAKASAAQSFQDINAFLDKVLVDEGIPADRLAVLSGALRKVLVQPDIVAKLEDKAITIKATRPEELQAYIADETRKWRGVVDAANIKQE